MNKFILLEASKATYKLILTEATANDLEVAKEKVVSILDEITAPDLISKIKGFLGGEATHASNESIKAIEKANKEVSDQLDAGQTDLAILKAKISSYLKVVQEEINKSDNSAGSTINSLPGLKSLIAKIQADIEANPTEEADIKELANTLKNDFLNISEIINSGISEVESEVTDSSVNAELVDDKVSTINETKENINTITKIADSIIKNLESLQSVLEKNLTNITKIVNDGLAATDKDDREAAGEDALDILNAVVSSCNKISEVLNFDKISTNKHDWEKELEKAGTDTEAINKVWDDYYTKEWGKDAEKVIDLGKTFRTELLKGGFSEALNPFVTFVKNNINKLNLNASTYPAVHNAYVSDFISQDDLRNSSENNILYNKALYYKQPKEILEYFGSQSKIFDNFNKLIEKAAERYNNKEEIASAIFDASIRIDNNNFPAAKVKLPDITELSSINKVKEAMVVCFGDKSFGKNIIKGDATADNIWKDIQNNFNNKQDAAKETIWSLGIKGNTDENGLLDYIKSKGIGKAPDETDALKIEKILGNYNIKGVRKLIKDLAIASKNATEEQLKD